MGAVNIIDPLANPKAEPLTKAYKEGAAGYEELGEFHEVKIHRDITNQDERFLYIVNQMLVKTRDHAIDHEKTGEAFHGAALVRTKSGKFYAAPNIHLTHQKTTRQCAEVNAITAAINAEGQDVEITDLWFEGGKTNLDKGISILPDQLGKRFCPCPSCRDVIWNNKNLEEDTKVHLLPINDGKWHLIPDDGREELEPNQVMTRNIRELFPQRNARLENIMPKEFKQVLERGWELINDKANIKAISGAAFDRENMNKLSLATGKEPKEAIKIINDAMIDKIHDLYHRANTPPENIRVAVVRLENGEYYMGTSLEGKGITSMQYAESEAVQASQTSDPNKAITDIFVIDMDQEKIKRILETKNTKKFNDLTKIKMPDGSARDRIIKNSPNKDGDFFDVFGKQIDKESGANVHMILLNNKDDFDPKKHMVSFSIADLVPYRWINPKMSAGNERG